MINTLRWFQPASTGGRATTKNIKYGTGYVELKYACNGFWLDRLETESDQNAWDLIFIPECTNVTTPGMPSLPMETVLVALPEDISNVSIELLNSVFKPVEGIFNISPAALENVLRILRPNFSISLIHRYTLRISRFRKNSPGLVLSRRYRACTLQVLFFLHFATFQKTSDWNTLIGLIFG